MGSIDSFYGLKMSLKFIRKSLSSFQDAVLFLFSGLYAGINSRALIRLPDNIDITQFHPFVGFVIMAQRCISGY